MKKLAKEWLEKLPEPYRSQALENVEKCPLIPDVMCESLSSGMLSSFIWEDTPQGLHYWKDIHRRADNGEFDKVAESATDKQVNGSHYKDMAIQPSEFIVRNNIGWHEGNAIKYLSRHPKKGGKIDLEKAMHCIELAIDHYYSDKPDKKTK